MKRSSLPGFLIAIAALATVCGGCKTVQLYDGPKLPREEVAHVSGDIPLSNAPLAVILRRVDGRTLNVGEHGVDVLPGTHRLLVDCRIQETSSVTRHSLEVELLAGRRYRLVAETGPGLRECVNVHVTSS